MGQGSSVSEAKKCRRQVTVATLQKWQKQYGREHRTLSWLRCDVDSRDKSLVEILWCDASRKHEKRLTGLRNFLVSGLLDLTTTKPAISLIMPIASSIVQL